MTAIKNSLNSKAMYCKSDALKLYDKGHRLLYLPKNATTLQFMCIQDSLRKPKGLRVCIIAMQLMESSEKMKFVARIHLGPKSKKSLDNVDVYAIPLCMVPQTGNQHTGSV